MAYSTEGVRVHISAKVQDCMDFLWNLTIIFVVIDMAMIDDCGRSCIQCLKTFRQLSPKDIFGPV